MSKTTLLFLLAYVLVAFIANLLSDDPEDSIGDRLLYQFLALIWPVTLIVGTILVWAKHRD